MTASQVSRSQIRINFSYRLEPGQLTRSFSPRKGLVYTFAKFIPSSRWPSFCALDSPPSVNGISLRPVCWPVIVQAVSPWRRGKLQGKLLIGLPVSVQPLQSVGRNSDQRGLGGNDMNGDVLHKILKATFSIEGLYKLRSTQHVQQVEGNPTRDVDSPCR